MPTLYSWISRETVNKTKQQLKTLNYITCIIVEKKSLQSKPLRLFALVSDA